MEAAWVTTVKQIASACQWIGEGLRSVYIRKLALCLISLIILHFYKYIRVRVEYG